MPRVRGRELEPQLQMRIAHCLFSLCNAPGTAICLEACRDVPASNTATLAPERAGHHLGKQKPCF